MKLKNFRLQENHDLWFLNQADQEDLPSKFCKLFYPRLFSASRSVKLVFHLQKIQNHKTKSIPMLHHLEYLSSTMVKQKPQRIWHKAHADKMIHQPQYQSCSIVLISLFLSFFSSSRPSQNKLSSKTHAAELWFCQSQSYKYHTIKTEKSIRAYALSF